MVMSLARCISAISAGDLNIRQPAVTGVASTNSSAAPPRADAVGDEEAHALLDADLAGRDAAVLQDAGDDRAPVLVFLPHADVVGELRDLARALFLEPGRRRRRARPSRGCTSRNGRSLRPQRTFDEVAHARPRLEDDRAHARARSSAAAPSRSARAARRPRSARPCRETASAPRWMGERSSCRCLVARRPGPQYDPAAAMAEVLTNARRDIFIAVSRTPASPSAPTYSGPARPPRARRRLES